nr:predicted protein [Ipomoea batatas]
MLKPHLLVVTHHPIRKPLRRRPLPQIYPHLPSRSSLIQILNLLVDLLQFLVNQPGEIVEVREDQAVQPFPRQALEHHLGYLLLPVLLVLLLQLLARLGDPLTDKPLLVHHLLALLHLRHPLELRHHPLRPRRARPHLRLVLVRAVNYRAGVDPAQRAQLAHLLHQPFLPLLQCRLSSRVVGDEGQLHLLPHMEVILEQIFGENVTGKRREPSMQDDEKFTVTARVGEQSDNERKWGIRTVYLIVMKILNPLLGQRFSTLDEGVGYYKEYAHFVGFDSEQHS